MQQLGADEHFQFQAFTELKGVLTPPPLGLGSADGGFPDGTQARRMQVSARFSF